MSPESHLGASHLARNRLGSKMHTLICYPAWIA